MKIGPLKSAFHKLEIFLLDNNDTPNKINYQFIEVSLIIIILVLILFLGFLLNIICTIDSFF